MKLRILLATFSAAILCATCTAFAAGDSAPTPEARKAAFESFPSCDRYARYDQENFYVGRPGSSRGVQVIPINDPANARELPTKTMSIDAARIGNTLWVLTFTELEEWDLTQNTRVATYPTYAYTHLPMEYREHPSAMAVYKDRLVIAHGRLGFSVFDTTKKIVVYQNKFIPEQTPKESMALGVTVSGHRAFFTLDDFTIADPGAKQAFRGIIIVNLDTNLIESTLDGMDPGSDAVATDGQKLIVSFWGFPIWTYDMKALVGKTVPAPIERLWHFPYDGHPTGQPSLDEKYYYTCYDRLKNGPGSGHVRVPLALDRAALHL